MSDQNFSTSHHYSVGKSEDQVNSLELQRFIRLYSMHRTFCSDSVNDRVLGPQDLETDVHNSSAHSHSLEMDDLVHRLSMFPETLTSYEHTFLHSLQQDPNVCSLDKLITLCEFASSHYPDALEEKGLKDKAISTYEHALDNIVVDSNGLSLIRPCFHRIGALLKGRYYQLGEAEDLHKAIWALEMCIGCTTADGKDLDGLYSSLLHLLGVHWNIVRDDKDLNQMLSYAEKALMLNPSNANAQYILGLNFVELCSFMHRIFSFDSVNDRIPEGQGLETNSAHSLEVDDLLCRWSMFPEALTPHEHTILLSLLQDCNICSLDRLITLSESAISHYPNDAPLKAMHLFLLGIALEKKRSKDKAIGAYEHALNVIVVDSNDLSLIRTCFHRIGVLLKGRYYQLGEIEDLHKAIWALEMCIVCTAGDEKLLDTYYHDLFVSLGTRWNLLKDKEDLDHFVSHAEKAVALNPSNVNAQYLLGYTLYISYSYHPRLVLIDQAILAMQSALSYSVPHDRMEVLIQLAITHHCRFHHVRNSFDNSACIKYLDQAMECGKLSFTLQIVLIRCLTRPEHSDIQSHEHAYSICKTLLANDSLSDNDWLLVLDEVGKPSSILTKSYENDCALKPDPCQLERCIQTIEYAIESIPPEHPQHAQKYYFLSLALLLQLEIKTPTVSDFEYAISIGIKLVEQVCGTDGLIIMDSGLTADCVVTLSRILLIYPIAFPSREHSKQCLSVLHQALCQSFHHRQIPLAIAIAEALLSLLTEDWKGCLNAFTIAMEDINHDTSGWLGLSVMQQHSAILGSGGGIDLAASFASHTAVSLGDSGKALEWIEQCRSIVWRRVLNLRVSMDILTNVDPTQAHRLKEVSNMLQRDAYFDLLGMEEGSLEMKKQQWHCLAEEWDELITQTRKLQGFADFLKPKDGAYFASHEFGGMVVLLSVCELECDAIVLGSNKGKIVSFQLRKMSEELATSLQKRLCKALQQSGRHSWDARASQIWSGYTGHDVMSDVLSVLWKTVVKPLFNFLDLKPHDSLGGSDPPRLWWCPTGPLSFLPLHVAGLYNTEECGTKVYEYVASSYTPTVGILADISNQPSEEFSGLLTVCQPHTPGQHSIPKTEDEVCSLIKVAVESGLTMDVTFLDNDDATPDAVLGGMAEHSWIHLACHAHQDPTQPLESAFMLAGDPAKGRPLKLTEIAERANTKADFAFLSACQTATGDTSLSEESVHLAAGMLMAGYRRVIATMWAVNDSDAPIIAEMVYKHMLSDGKADSGKSCLALHYATALLRQERGEMNFMSWVPFIHYGA